MVCALDLADLECSDLSLVLHGRPATRLCGATTHALGSGVFQHHIPGLGAFVSKILSKNLTWFSHTNGSAEPWSGKNIAGSEIESLTQFRETRDS